MFFSTWSKTAKLIGGSVALAVVSVPVAVLADASNPVYMPKKKVKAKAKPRHVAPKARPRAVAKPVVQQPVYTPEPVYTAPPAPVYTSPPAPVYTPPPPPVAPAPAPVAAPVAAKSGHGWLLGLLGAAALAGGIVLASGGDNSTSP